MLDKFKAFTRHFIIAATPLVAAFLATTVIPQLQDQFAGSATVSFALTMALLYLTPITHKYGVGKTTNVAVDA